MIDKIIGACDRWTDFKADIKVELKKVISSDYKLLKNNKRYCDLHKGKRCFILGNGPSLKSENLSLLKDEIVFTVNQAARNPQFGEINSNYHFWADPIFFNIDENSPEDIELLDTMLSVGDFNPELQCFFPIDQIEFVKTFDIGKRMNVNYFCSNSYMYEGYSKKYDYTKRVIGFGTVVQWCIAMAIYMGIKEIYLLGCDNTGIITSVKSYLHKNYESDYFYKVTDNEKKRLEKAVAANSLESYIKSYLHTLQDYRRLFQYCSKRQISLVNCSSETVIDSLPRKSMKEVLGIE